MADIILKNGIIEIGVNLHGAELKSLRRTDTGTEYLWCGDPAYWNRTSPVLFPFVGGVRNGVYRHEGTEYQMSQHGFARDRDFTLISQTEDAVWFGLEDDEESRGVYPFAFHLEIGYQLLENGVKVMWKVENPSEETMYFAIGAHPAFNCPLKEGDKQTDCALRLQDRDGKNLAYFINTIFGQGGTVTNAHEAVNLQEGILPVTETLFDYDAKVIEEGQTQRVSLLDGNGEEYLAVEFSAPLVGIWSPPKKKAPFICIEPWYGRCDKDVFEGELKDREWELKLAPGGVFQAEYKIVVQ
jgi:galactose mutarotase-like enzyme